MQVSAAGRDQERDQRDDRENDVGRLPPRNSRGSIHHDEPSVEDEAKADKGDERRRAGIGRGSDANQEVGEHRQGEKRRAAGENEVGGSTPRLEASQPTVDLAMPPRLRKW